jgi:small subunit ribosomal protein S18
MRKAFAPARQPAPLQGSRQPRAQGSPSSGAASVSAQALSQLEALSRRQALSKRLPRRWQAGQVYAPHDLSSVEASKHAIMRRTPPRDVFDLASVNPIHHYKNFALLSQFVSETGRIKGSRETGLRPVNQRRIAKAVRRAVGLGLMPSVYKHPEVLGMEIGLVRDVGGRW